MAPTRKPSGWDEGLAVKRRPLPQIEALLADHGLPSALAMAARGTGVNLERGMLTFAAVYRVQKPLQANRHGFVLAGDLLRFLGAYVFPYDNGLRLHFEPADRPGDDFCLEFEGNFPEAEGFVRMLDDRTTAEYLTAIEDPDPARGTALAGVAETLRATRAQTEQLYDQAVDAATPEYEKRVIELGTDCRLWGNLAYTYVMGSEGADAAALDHQTLKFGKVYRALHDIKGTRSGVLTAGELVFFTGVTTQYIEEVTLWFDTMSGQLIDLVFYPSDAAAGPACAPLHHTADYFESVTTGQTERGIELIQARETLISLRQQREALT